MNKRPIRILLVDDEDVDRMACARALALDTTHDYTVLEAQTGQAGLQRIRTEQPDAIILDYRLPDQTGLEFVASLHASANGKRTEPPPILVLTGHDSSTIAAELMRCGVSEYLIKDLELQYLKLLPAVVHRMLQTRRMADSQRQAVAKYRLLVEQMPAITYVYPLRDDGDDPYVSPQIGMLGYSPQDWTAGRAFHLSRIHPGDRARVESLLAHSMESGKPLRTSYRVMTREGRHLWFRDHANILRDDKQRPIFLQGVMFDITQSKADEQELQASREALRRLSAHQDRIKEQERKRIAQEIHDELGGMLTGIKAYVSVSIARAQRDGRAVDVLLTDAVRLADEAIAAVRRVIADLRPSVLDQLGLWEAIAWYAEQVESQSGLRHKCLISPTAKVSTLDPDMATMLFRIVQEALTNVTRHAQASMVTIRANTNGPTLELDISDDGKGIDASKFPIGDSWGIFGMRERARHLGGDLIIHSEGSRGTAVRVRIPLRAIHDAPQP
ncbi:response regulator [Bordetella sp. FB-8]|uniref:hybrid sensor histidine kinase/response regulator n=1 Tax=Bordetella sp. FB-8 TaxID=1159870 RepID=UPI0003642207|nr:response regulator [Bordetella sp. FB-8]